MKTLYKTGVIGWISSRFRAFGRDQSVSKFWIRLVARSKDDFSYIEIPRIFELLQRSFSVPVHLMVENLADIPDAAVDAFNKVLRLKPYLVDAASFTWVRRPRLFWVTWDISTMAGEMLEDKGLYYVWHFPPCRVLRDSWVDEGSSWTGANEALLPVFTRSHCRTTQPCEPTNAEASSAAVSRWQADGCRFDVSNYEAEHMLTSPDGFLRLPALEERERLLGVDDNYFSEGLHPKLKGEERLLVGEQLMGGTFCVFSIMVLMDELLATHGSVRARQQAEFFSRGVFVKQTPPCMC